MKKSMIIIAGIFFSVSLGLVSCKKEGCTDENAINYSSSAKSDDGSCIYEDAPEDNSGGSYVPNFGGTFSTLVAVKTFVTTSTPIGDVDMEIGIATAVFSENGGDSFISAGTVKVDNETMDYTNDAYHSTPSATNPTGLEFGNTVSWEGSGNAWPSFSASTSQGFASVGAIQSGTPSTSSSYTLYNDYVSGADSVLFMVGGASDHLVRVVAGNTSSYTFTAQEMSTIGTGMGIVQIVGLKYDVQEIGGRDYYLINETVQAKNVDIQ